MYGIEILRVHQAPTGSTYIHGQGADVDTVVYPVPHDSWVAPDKLVRYMRNWYSSLGYSDCSVAEGYDAGTDGTPGHWQAMRKGMHNVIIVGSPQLFLRWLAYTHAACAVFAGGSTKDERIALSQQIRAGLYESDACQAAELLWGIRDNLERTMECYIRRHGLEQGNLGAYLR